VLSTRNWEEPPAEGAAAAGLPAMLVLDDGARQRFLEGKPRYTPLHQVMTSAKEKFAATPIPAPMPPYLNGAKGRLNALPIGLTTPVMFYNKDAFTRVGLDPAMPPTHWFTLQAALGTLRDGGYACPYTSARPTLIHVDNLTALHNEPFARKTGKTGESLAINGLVQVKHLALMSSWYKSRYLHIFGRGDEAVPMFSGGQCQVLTARSSAWPQISAMRSSTSVSRHCLSMTTSAARRATRWPMAPACGWPPVAAPPKRRPSRASSASCSTPTVRPGGRWPPVSFR
jgi:sn-glycerol 3-phosphate transport system substrate-binding protein